MGLLRIFALTLAAAAGVAAGPSVQELPLHLSAFAVSTGGVHSDPVAARVDITINRWSTAAQAQRLQALLKDKGPQALLDELQKQKPVGTIRTPGNLAYDLRFAQQQPGEDGGQRIMLATDRPMSYWEIVNRPRSVDYPFTFIELRLNGRGEGEGKLSLATRVDVSSDGRMIELENYDSQPIQLNDVRRQSGK